MRSQTQDAGDEEFFVLARKLGVDPMAEVDPRGQFLFSSGRSRCRTCQAKVMCRQIMHRTDAKLADFAPICPNTDLMFYLSQLGLPHAA